MTNAERIEEALRKRQQAGLPDKPTVAERQGGTARTNPPPEFTNKVPNTDAKVVNGHYVPDDSTTTLQGVPVVDPSVLAERQAQFEKQEAEKNRSRGKLSTLLNGGLGVIGSPQLGRKSLIGY